MLRSNFFISTHFLYKLLPIFCTHTMLEISVYYNTQNIIQFCTFLVQINAFGFARIFCSRFDLIFYTPHLVRRASSSICILNTKYYIFSNFQFSKLPRTDLKIAPMALSFILPPFPFFTKQTKRKTPYKTLHTLSSLFKRVAK